MVKLIDKVDQKNTRTISAIVHKWLEMSFAPPEENMAGQMEADTRALSLPIKIADEVKGTAARLAYNFANARFFLIKIMMEVRSFFVSHNLAYTPPTLLPVG